MTQALIKEFFEAINNENASQVTTVLKKAESQGQLEAVLTAKDNGIVGLALSIRMDYNDCTKAIYEVLFQNIALLEKVSKIKDEYESTPIVSIISSGNLKLFNEIKDLARNAKKLAEFLGAKDPTGRTPLHWAVIEGKKEIIESQFDEILAKKNLKPLALAQDDSDSSPLHWAVDGDQAEVVDLFMQKGATKPKLLEGMLTAVDGTLRTTLMYAIATDKSETVIKSMLSALIASKDVGLIKKVLVELADNTSSTPLLVLMEDKYKATVEYIFEQAKAAGVLSDVLSFTISGQTLEEVAVGQTEILGLIHTYQVQANHAPTANDFTLLPVAGDTAAPVKLNVLSGADDVDLSKGDKLKVTNVTPSTGFKGTLDLNPITGEVTYLPESNTNGNYSFEYTVTDKLGATATAKATIPVQFTNHAPTATNLTLSIVAGDITVPTQLNVLAGADDIDKAVGDELKVTNVTPSKGFKGTLNLNPTTGEVTYLPESNTNGNYSFEYIVTDKSGATATGTATIPVQFANHAPTATDFALPVVAGDTVAPVKLNVLAGANDVDISVGDELKVTNVTPSKGFEGDLNLNPTTGEVTYLPGSNKSGNYSFEFIVTDKSGATATGTATIPVQFANHAPTATNFTLPAVAGNITAPVKLNVLAGANDVDISVGDELKVTKVTPSKGFGGDLNLNPTTGEVTYLPGSNKSGNYSFEYIVTDKLGATATGTATIPVESSCPSLSADQKQEAVKKVFYADTFLKIFNLAQEINSNLTTWDAATLKAKYDALKGLEATMSGLPGISPKAGKELSCFTKDTITGRAAYCTGGATGSNPSQGNYKYKSDNIKKDIEGILQNYSGTPSVQYDAKKNFADALTIAGGDKDCLKEIVIDSCTAHSGSNACNTLVASSYDWTDVNTLA